MDTSSSKSIKEEHENPTVEGRAADESLVSQRHPDQSLSCVRENTNMLSQQSLKPTVSILMQKLVKMVSLSENSEDKCSAVLPRINKDLTGRTNIILCQSQATQSVTDEAPEQQKASVSDKPSDKNLSADHIDEAPEQQASASDKLSDNNLSSDHIDEAPEQQQASASNKLSDNNLSSDHIDEAPEQQKASALDELSDKNLSADHIDEAPELQASASDKLFDNNLSSDHIDEAPEQQQASASDKLSDKNLSSDHIDEAPEQQKASASDKLSDKNLSADHIDEAPEQSASDKLSDKNLLSDHIDEAPEQQHTSALDKLSDINSSTYHIDEAPEQQQAPASDKFSDKNLLSDHIDEAPEQQHTSALDKHSDSNSSTEHIDEAPEQPASASDKLSDNNLLSDHIDEAPEQQHTSALDKLSDSNSSSDHIDEAPEQQAPDLGKLSDKTLLSDNIDEAPEQQHTSALDKLSDINSSTDHIDEASEQQQAPASDKLSDKNLLSDHIDEAPEQEKASALDKLSDINSSSDHIDEAPEQPTSENLTVQDIIVTDTITSSAHSNEDFGDLRSENAALSKVLRKSATLKLKTDILFNIGCTYNTLLDSSKKDMVTEQNKQFLAAEKDSVCKLEEQIYAGKETDEFVTPMSSEKTVSNQVPCDFTDKQLKPSESAYSDTASHVPQTEAMHCNQQYPKYIVVHKNKSGGKQQDSKKPGEKLTSLLERLTAVRGLAVAPTNLTRGDSGALTKPTSLTVTKTETSVNLFNTLETSSASGSSTGSIHIEQGVPQYTSKPSSCTTVNSIMASPQASQHPVSHGSILKQTISPAHKHLGKDLDTSLSTLFRKGSFRIIRKGDSVESIALISRNMPKSLSAMQNRLPQASSETAAQVLRIHEPDKESKYCFTSPETSFMSLEQPALTSVGNSFFGYLSRKDSQTSPATFKVYKRHKTSVGSTNDSDPKPVSTQSTIAKLKKRLSHLQLTGSQHHASPQMTTSTSGITKTPTIYSLLSNSTATPISVLKPSQHPISADVAVATTTSIPISSMITPETTKSSSVASVILAPYCLPTSSGQVLFHPVSYALVTRSGSSALSPGITTLAFSKSAVTSAAGKLSMMKAPKAPCTSLITPTQSSTSSVIVTPTAALATPVTTILAISTRANSKSEVPVGIVTKSNLAAVCNQTKDVQHAIIQPSTNTQLNCSELITKLAQQSIPGIYTFRQATGVESSLLQSLNTAMQPSLKQDNPHSAMTSTSSLRFILSRASTSNASAKSACLQAQSDLSTMSSITTYPTSKATLISVTSKTGHASVTSKTAHSIVTSNNAQISVIPKITPTYATSKAAQVSVTLPVIDNNSKHSPILLCPKPVKVTASHPANIPVVKHLSQTLKLVVPTTSKAVSLLTTSSVQNIQSSMSAFNGKPAASVTRVHAKRKLICKAVKSINSTLSTLNDLRKSSVVNTVQNPSLKNVSSAAGTDITRKPRENTFYPATLRTGQGSVSVMVLAPDIDDDSSDTGMSNLMFPNEPAFVYEDAKATATSVNDCLSDRLSDVRYPEKSYSSYQDVEGTATGTDDVLLKRVSEMGTSDLGCPEKSTTCDQDIMGSSSHVEDTLLDKVLDADELDLRYSKEVETSGQDFQHRATSFDDEEDTDSDLETVNMEEQDMSVLRQLLTTRGSVRPPDDYTTSSKQFQVGKVLKTEVVDGIIGRKCSMEPVAAKRKSLVSILSFPDAAEDRSSSNSVSAQQPVLHSFTTSKQNDTDETMTRYSEVSEFCGLKIESVFSLSGSHDFEDNYFQSCNNTDSQLQEFSNEQREVFKINESDDWKNFVTPCFVVIEQLSKSEILAKKSDNISSKCSGHCRKRTLDYLCNLNLLTCVNHPDISSFLKPKRRRIALKEILGKATKHKTVISESCVNETKTETSARCSPFERGQKQEPAYKLHNKPSTSAVLPSPILFNTVQSSVVYKSDLHEKEQSILPVQNDQNTNKMSLSSLDNSDLGFHVGLKQLQKQVDRKRAKMLISKVSRKTKEESLMKSKIKPHTSTKKVPLFIDILKTTEANSSNTTKHNVFAKISSRSHDNSLPLTLSNTSHNIPSKRHLASAEVLPPCIKKFRFNRSGISSKSGTRNKSVFKDPISASMVPASASKVPISASKLITKTNVNIQPKLQTLPAERINAALQSLNSYLAATGRKPTVGNTQYILLKIDDQHVLIKLPASSNSAVQNSVKLSNVKMVSVTSTDSHVSQSNVSKPSYQQMQFEANSKVAKTVSKLDATRIADTVSRTNIASTTSKTATNMNSTYVIANNAPGIAQLAFSIVKSASGAPSLVSGIANTSSKTILLSSSIANTVSKTSSSSIANTVSKTSSSSITNTFKTLSSSFANTSKTLSSSFANTTKTLSSNFANTSKTLSSSTANTSKTLSSSTANIASNSKNISLRITKTTSKSTESICNTEKTFASSEKIISTNVEEPKSTPQQDIHQSISDSSTDNSTSHIDHSYVTCNFNEYPDLISQRPSEFLESQNIKNLTSLNTVNVSAGLCNVLSSPTVSDCLLRGGRDASNIVLSRLPPNSSLLPERRKKPALTEEERKVKLRRLEERYPFPPGVVIKSEPDDLGYEMSTGWSDASQTSLTDNFPVAPTVHSLPRESPVMSSQHQIWSVANSDNTGSYLPLADDEGLHTQESGRVMDVLDLPANSALYLEDTSATESVENEESSSELDEPPALVDETTADDLGQIMQEDNIMDIQEDMPPILQPMFTSSCSSVTEDLDTMESENTDFVLEKSTHTRTLSSDGTKQPTAAEESTIVIGSISTTSLHSESSLDSGIETNIHSGSSSFTSVKEPVAPAAEKVFSKNLKIQHLKELLKKKQMEVENMKKMQSEFPSLDLDLI